MCNILLNITEKLTEKDQNDRKILCKLLVVICVSIIPYIFTLHGDFVFDDSEAIVKNSDVTGNSSTDLFYNDFWGANIQSNFSHKSYRPLTILSFRFNYFISGNYLDPYHFKITNLVIHTICCVLLWFLYQAILRGVGYNPLNGHIDIAFWSTLVFGVHPVHDEAICGIVGRADLSAACTFFTSFLLYYKGSRCKGLVSGLFIAAAVFTAGVSMLLKENGVTVLGFCFMYELTKLSKRSKHGVSVVRLFLLIICSVALLSARWLLMGGIKPEFKPIDNPAAFSDNQLTKLLTYHYIYLLNILLLIWPQWLCFDWSMGCVPLIENTLDCRIVGLLLLYIYALMCAYFLLNRRNFGITKRAYIAALSLMAIPFLPASNIFFPVGFVIAERILYISSAGYCLFLILGLNKILAISKGHCRTMIISLFYFLLLVYGTRSWQRSYQWQNEYRLFTSGLAVCPLNAKVHYNVAKVADAHNHTEWALAEYREAIRLYPEYYQAMNNLANLLKNEKQYPAAEYYLKAAIGLKKEFPAAWMNLGIVLANTRRHKESEVAYETALSYRASYPDCYYNLGNLYLEMNRTDEAMRAWQHAIQLNSKHALAWSNLLALLDNSGQMEEADRMVPDALLELPESPSINFVIANIYGKLGRYHEAEKYFKRAIELFGSRVQAVHYANLGVLYHRWRKYKLAEGMYLEALTVDPMFKSAQKNLISVRKNIK